MCHGKKEKIEEKKVDQEYIRTKNWVICSINWVIDKT